MDLLHKKPMAEWDRQMEEDLNSHEGQTFINGSSLAISRTRPLFHGYGDGGQRRKNRPFTGILTLHNIKLNSMLFSRREIKSCLVTDESFYAQNHAIVLEEVREFLILKHLPETATGLNPFICR